MKPIDRFKKFRDDYVIHQVEKAKLPDFEDDYFVRRRITFSGRVQHVGFRLELERMATRLGLTGWVKNLENGDVQAEIQGYESRIRFLLKFMRSLKRIKINTMENKLFKEKILHTRILLNKLRQEKIWQIRIKAFSWHRLYPTAGTKQRM